MGARGGRAVGRARLGWTAGGPGYSLAHSRREKPTFSCCDPSSDAIWALCQTSGFTETNRAKTGSAALAAHMGGCGSPRAFRRYVQAPIGSKRARVMSVSAKSRFWGVPGRAPVAVKGLSRVWRGGVGGEGVCSEP